MYNSEDYNYTNGCKSYKTKHLNLILSTHLQRLAIIRYFYCTSESHVCTSNAANAVNINLFGDDFVYDVIHAQRLNSISK